MKIKRRCLTFTLFILTLFSTSIITPIPAQEETSEEPLQEPPLLGKDELNGTSIYWDRQQEAFEESWSWLSQAWEFGPYPTFKIFLQNGTEVTDSNYIPLGELFNVVINVKKNIFTGNVTLGRAGLNWNAELRSENGTVTGYAHCRMVYVNEINTIYWNESDTWHVESAVFNETEISVPPGEPPPPGAGVSFYNFSEGLSNVTETDESWIIEIVGSFNDTAPVGPFWVDLEITDSKDSWIDFGYVAWEGKVSPHRMVAVGEPGLMYGGFRDTWTFEKLDLENNPTYSVSRGAPWKMRINVTSSELANVTIGFELPWEVKTYVNVTGWHDVTVTEYGGWTYNKTSDHYYWNSSVPVTRVKQVYGPHLEERWTFFDHGLEVNVTRVYWDPITGNETYETFTEWVQERMYLIYNHSDHSFSVKQGYSYWSYDPDIQREREYLVLYPLNTSDPTTRFYNLSINDCAWYQTAPDKYVIEFAGAFSNATHSGRNEYRIQEPLVYNSYERIWPNWETISPSDFQIAVDTLVAITTIIDKDGRSIKGRMFQTDPGNSFRIQSKLQGGGVSYADIDGVGVVFRTGSGKWVSEFENYWSDVEIRLVKDFTTGKLISTSYNRTGKNIYAYGPHKGWELVNVTDWHQEYNETTGKWEWVESSRLMWNETIVTDWHWEYLSLNQTEYALNQSSPDIWINREENWIPDDDPAFRTSSSYAVLNSANMSLINGVITVFLNVSFTQNAPHTNYWWEMCFKNMTFGRDWSEGWGEHTVLEWTSESVYYVNGTATGGQPWYVTRPSTPLYTMYNGQKYPLEEVPYITVSDEDLLLRGRTHYDWGRQKDVTEYMFWDPYDPSLGTEPRYYELMNGTKIYVKEAYQAVIRTLKLNTTDAYKITGMGNVPVPNGTVFSTFMGHAMEDWSLSYWDEALQRDVVPYYYELLNGTRIYRNDGFETQIFNWTTNLWELSNKVYRENQTAILVKRLGQGVTLNQTILVFLRDYGSWWQLLPDGTGYYLVMENGTIITHPDPWSVSDEDRIVTIGSLNYTIDWPTEYYEGTYRNQTLTIRRDHVHNFYYTDLDLQGGFKHELPYPGALAMSWWELERVESEGGRLRTFKSITLNGTKYTIYLSENGKDYYILIGGNRTSVTRPAKDIGYFYAEINGEEYWNIEQRGWILRLGTLSERSGQFIPVGSPLKTITGRDPLSQMWMEHNRWGYDRENSTLYVMAPNGTRYDVNSEIYLMMWKVQIDNETYYTMDPWESWEDVYIPETGEYLQRPYITDLNQTKIYFNWDTNPASWIDEIHVPIPGENYTKLIPFNWTRQPIFDTIYIFNITIPALPWDPSHTGVFYEDGVEVPINSTFKVFGTHWGPGTRHQYSWFDGEWLSEGAFVPGIEAPWNKTKYVQYFTALDGTRIYSEYGFGWMGDRWGDPELGELRQWDYVNGDPIGGNRTANVVEGGYCIYLNDTIKVDVTTEWPQGGWPDEYLIMKNGTYLNVYWFNDTYITELNNKTYFFRQVITYYNVTDSGVVYNIVDPFMNDPYQILTPNFYSVPTIAFNQATWLRMNVTSNAVLRDGFGLYLINASDFSRLDIEPVDNWWNFSESVRGDVFKDQWELEHAYPRFNVTMDGQEYFVLDPSPVIGRWEGEGDIEWNTYRYPSTINVTLDGKNHTIVLLEGSYWKPDLHWRRIETITRNGTTLEVEDQSWWKPHYEVSINENWTEIMLSEMNIYKKHAMWGEIYRWMLTDMQVYSLRSTWDIVVGTPEWGMWGIRSFKVVPETGAVDLDGDLTTTEDQYFVRRLHKGSDMWNRTEDRMFVEILWDPNASMVEDEVHIGAWMGKVHTEWAFTWNETYIWHYASNMSVVSSATMQQINATLLDSETGTPNPGYWDLAHMARNATWADLLARAEREGWEWVKDNKHEWDWLWFGTQQDYVTAWSDENGTKTAGVGLRYEFAGLSLYNSTEQTHFFMPENVSAISFVSPGEAFGNMNATGEMVVPLNETITFGVAFENVTGTLFPYKEDRSMWGWWDGIIYGADFDQPNFMNKPTETTVDEMAFKVHFSANATNDSQIYNEASMKIDQDMGNWEMEPHVIDGRKETVNNVSTYLTGNDVLLDRSLAVNYYVTAFTEMDWSVIDEKGEDLDNRNVTASSKFDVASKLANASFASVRLGSTYDWQKPVAVNDTKRTFNVTSKTTPIGSFEASFKSEAGKSSTGFEISAMMYFLTVGFERWDGYAVSNDPELMIYTYTGIMAESDATPPNIDIPSREPSGDVMPNQPVKVSVNVTDAETGVKNVTLSYRTNGGPWTNLTMTYNSTTRLYEAIIPGQPAGTWVRYMITAYDNAGNSKTEDNVGGYYVYTVVPEFPSIAILLLLMILTTLAVIFLKRKFSNPKNPSSPSELFVHVHVAT